MPRKKIKNPACYDAIIAGGGLAGLSMATRLGSAGLSVLVVEREEQAKLTSTIFEGRTTALAYGSKGILETCGVWQKLAGHVCPIDDIRVADQHAPQIVDFESGNIGGNPFGYIVENVFFRAALFQRVHEMENITLACGISIVSVDQQSGRVRLSLSNGMEAESPLLIAADGRHSFCRNQAGIKSRTWSYNQSALVCVFNHSEPHHNQALENFYPDGPFAVLPMTGNRSSLVWTEHPRTAATLTTMPEDQFCELLAERGCDHMGTLSLASTRMLYPLHFMLADDLWKDRTALIGEAAHGMHPIAGQGFNLSLRDVAVLADLIEAAPDPGAPELLRAYASKRHLDHFTFMMATDVLEKLFSNNVTPVKWARRFGLGVVQRLPFAKNFFGRMAMGLLTQP